MEGKEPYGELAELSNAEFISQIVWQQYRPTIPNHWQEELKEVVMRCLDDSPLYRPSGEEVVTILTQISQESALRNDTNGIQWWKKNFNFSRVVMWKDFIAAFSEEFPDGAGFEPIMLLMLLCNTGTDMNSKVGDERFGFILYLCGPWSELQKNIIYLVSQLWFFGDMTARRVALHLTGQQPGTFLVRFCKTHSCYAINYLNSKSQIQQELIHVIVPSAHGKRFFKNNEVRYGSLAEVIQSNPKLKGPCPNSPFSQFSPLSAHLVSWAEGHSFLD
eukprot:TRINITY_DN7577_c0_g2_i3.p1 TRINITY_DN7577_c0_g2~~TRINITY_DN7577_c0_g2_i3.p1  ORF type:complete len:275 (-),score=68.83 TRINITY_DN7577_c0_g2_i3:324-1148(-)